MTVDLEDYFCDLEFNKWPKFESRIIETTNLLLELFRKYNVKATFFTVGYIAEKFPELIKKIILVGHEVASHSYAHLDIRKISKEEFENDFLKSLSVIEKISGEKVLGFRAPFFSIDKSRIWAFEILRKNLKYDSSIFPVRTPLYGIPEAPTAIYHPSKSNFLKHDEYEEFLELPPAIYHFPIIGNIPIAGGFHLRFLPFFLINKGIRKLNKCNLPAICYIHPKDLDPKMPRLSEYSWHYYYGLNSAQKKFEKLLHDFAFESVRDYLKL